MRWQRRAKRALDLAASGTGLLITAPILGAVAVAVRATMGSPVFFRQTRVGQHERHFRIHKFRSMRDPAFEGEGDEARITRLGHFLRGTSLDELPQLIDVFRGEMSLVGPRPLLVRYVDRYSPRQRKRHAVKPGITGLAQVNGRNQASWNQKFAYDVAYVENWSLAMDIAILARTAATVVKRDGIASDQHATMPEFMGDPPAADPKG